MISWCVTGLFKVGVLNVPCVWSLNLLSMWKRRSLFCFSWGPLGYVFSLFLVLCRKAVVWVLKMILTNILPRDLALHRPILDYFKGNWQLMNLFLSKVLAGLLALGYLFVHWNAHPCGLWWAFSSLFPDSVSNTGRFFPQLLLLSAFHKILSLTLEKRGSSISFRIPVGHNAGRASCVQMFAFS